MTTGGTYSKKSAGVKYNASVVEILNDYSMDVVECFKDVPQEHCVNTLHALVIYLRYLQCENESLKALMQVVAVDNSVDNGTVQHKLYSRVYDLREFVVATRHVNTARYSSDRWVTKGGKEMSTAEFVIAIVNILKGAPK